MTANESWNALCDLEEFIPGVAQHTDAVSGTFGANDWPHIEAGWAAVASYALSRQSEAAQQMARLELKEAGNP